jgi:hypothetical protein
VEKTTVAVLYIQESRTLTHIAKVFRGAKMWRTTFLGKQCNMNEELVSAKITNCTNRIRIKNTGQYLHRIKRKWENKIK